MIVEFYGLPGAGKTTTIKYLTENSFNNIYWIPEGKTIPKKAFFRHIFTFEFFCFVIISVKLMLKKKKYDSTDKKSFKLMIRSYLKYMYLRKHKDTIYCNDHGIVQCLSSLIWEEDYLILTAEELIKFILKKNHSDVMWIYSYNENLAEIWKRISERKADRRIKRMPKEQAFALLRLQKNFFDRIFILSSDTGGAIKIDTNDDFKKNAGYIEKELVSM